MPPVPQHCPSPRELDDLELLVTGALAPTVVFNEPGSPVTLVLPPDVAERATAAGAVELVDPEGLPLAQVDLPGGTIEPLTHAQYGPFRRHYLSPVETRSRYAGRTFVPLVDALTLPQIAAIAGVGPVVLLPLVGHGTPDLSPVALLRATLAAAALLPDAEVVAIPLASHGDPDADHELGIQVVSNYAGPDPVVGVTDDPTGTFSDDIAEIVTRDRPAASDQGLVLFFTGLSGSGKSTLARALMDRLLEHGTRSLTSLDGDVVRRNLSAGLTFSKEDRETNIRRIGWVAAEIARHGGVAVCSPIAPFDETRQQVRAMVDDAGGAFFLVHVATPLEECERRDRKGLYAKARRGEIPEFTGISSPYEEPQDADVRVDTTGRTIEDALDDVLVALRDAGYLDLTEGGDGLDTPSLVPRDGYSTDDSASGRAESPLGGRVASASERIETPADGGLDTPSLVPRDGYSTDDNAGLGILEPESTSTAEEGALAPGLPVVEEGALAPASPVVEEGALAPVSKPPTTTEPREAPIRVLYVCTANICRSPFMELASRHLAGSAATVTFASAGTRGFDGAPMDPPMAATLKARGIPGAGSFRSRPFRTEHLVNADLVLTAEASHRQFILDDHAGAFRKIFTLGQFADSVQGLGGDLHGRQLLSAVAQHRASTVSALDVPDPYGRGPEAAEAAATTLDALLRVVLPALTGARKIPS